MWKAIIKIMTKILKSHTGREILKAGVDVYVDKNDNKLTRESANAIKNVLDEID